MAGVLKLSDQKFKIILKYMQWVIIEKVNNMQKQVGNVSGWIMEILQKNQKEMLKL